MGICCSVESSISQAPPASASDPGPLPDIDPAPSSTGHLIGGDISLLVSDVGNSWFSIATTNFTTLMTRVKDAVRGKNVSEESDLLPAIPDGATGSTKLRVFTFEQLKVATFNFKDGMVLGKGGFGSVYKGLVKEKMLYMTTKKVRIAVKKLDFNSKQGLRQWQTEVGFLGRVSHPNIVNLLGYCQEDENKELLIVYEFMEKGSLNYHLFSKNSNRLLPWEIRLKIATGMAQALAYLHTMERPIIFRDLKTSNILLDESYTPKLSDFGLAKWGPDEGYTYVNGNVMGTRGYICPKYKASGMLFVKSDVYSFGVVLLELLAGKRVIDKSREPSQQDLREWALPLLSDRTKLRRIMDPRLQGKYATKQAAEVAMLAVRCLKPRPIFRPSMKEVAETLEQLNLQDISIKVQKKEDIQMNSSSFMGVQNVIHEEHEEVYRTGRGVEHGNRTLRTWRSAQDREKWRT